MADQTQSDGFEHVSPEDAPEALVSATPGRGGAEPGGEGPHGVAPVTPAATGDSSEDVLAPATSGRDGAEPA